MATTTRVYKGKTYVTHLLRRSIRKGKTVTHETLGNLSHLPAHVIEIIKRSLKGETFVPAAEAFRITCTRPHGHVEAVLTMIRKLGIDELIASKPSPQRDLVIAMIAERLLFPSSKLAHTRHWHGTTLAEELEVAYATEDDLYEAMDWLLKRQGAIEKRLAKRHLGEGALVLYDVTSSYYEGKTCRWLASATTAMARPVARSSSMACSPMPTAGRWPCRSIPATRQTPRPSRIRWTPREAVRPVRVVLVGDRGMLTQTQIDVLKKHPGLGWISALRSGAIRRLLADGHLVKKDLEAEHLGEISSPDFPGERLVACYNRQLAEQRRHKREELLAATQAELEALAASVGRPRAADMGVRAGKIINDYEMAKRFTLAIRDGPWDGHARMMRSRKRRLWMGST